MSTTTNPKRSAKARFFESYRNYHRHFGEMPFFICHLAPGDASALLDIACRVDARLTPVHVAWWFAACERLAAH